MKTITFYLALLAVALSGTTECPCINTVSTTGTGKVFATPDLATFTVSVSETRPTTQEASQAANQKTSQVLAVFASRGVRQTDIKTSQLSVYPTYDYPDGKQVLKGQQATQSIDGKLRNVPADGSTVALLIDALAAIDGITVSSVNFDVDNKTPLRAQARRIAFAEAKVKAEQFAQLSGQPLGTPFSINEGQV